jgi:ribosome recycling factor
VRGKKKKTMVRDAVDEAREQIMKAWKEEAWKEEEHAKGQNPVTGLRDARQSLIDQQSDGEKSATRNPKGYVTMC